MHRIPLCLLALGLSLTAQAQDGRTTSPAATVSAFLEQRQESPAPGAPTGRVLMRMAPLLSPELVCLLGAASRYRDAFEANTPGEASPFSNTDLFSSHATGHTQASPGTPSTEQGLISVPVHMRFQAEEGNPAVEWTDEFHLRRDGQRWRIQDITYSADTVEGRPGNLVRWLRDTLGHSDARANWNSAELKGCPAPTAAKPAQKKTH
ncbi:hypothetical protein [Candidatus Dactylopiibacterium carminicum]|uniref:hypothetical protein n=1 Tax=Candidatus Dactylopiibacterium carminicum TaxID=857335 RepID=UPI0011410A15|nr:hypothetical protein [Candidatus Dactylopiibacterium carminicum]